MPVARANAKQGHVAEAKFESCRIKLQRLKVMQTVKSRNLFAGRTENLHSNRVRGITIEFAY